MKIVYTLEEIKNIICEFTQKSIGGEKPVEVAFIHKYSDFSGENEVENITPIDRIEVRYSTTPLTPEVNIKKV